MAVQHTWKILDKECSGLLSMGKAIRQNCLDCSGGSIPDVRSCEIKTCPLFPFRMGKDPGKKRILTEEQKTVIAERFKKAREAQKP